MRKKKTNTRKNTVPIQVKWSVP